MKFQKEKKANGGDKHYQYSTYGFKKYNINLTFRILQQTSSEVTVKTITQSLFKKIKRGTGDKLRKLLTKTSCS